MPHPSCRVAFHTVFNFELPLRACHNVNGYDVVDSSISATSELKLRSALLYVQTPLVSALRPLWVLFS